MQMTHDPSVRMEAYGGHEIIFDSACLTVGLVGLQTHSMAIFLLSSSFILFIQELAKNTHWESSSWEGKNRSPWNSYFLPK